MKIVRAETDGVQSATVGAGITPGRGPCSWFSGALQGLDSQSYNSEMPAAKHIQRPIGVWATKELRKGGKSPPKKPSPTTVQLLPFDAGKKNPNDPSTSPPIPSLRVLNQRPGHGTSDRPRFCLNSKIVRAARQREANRPLFTCFASREFPVCFFLSFSLNCHSLQDLDSAQISFVCANTGADT